jgi:hypothetical protein
MTDKPAVGQQRTAVASIDQRSERQSRDCLAGAEGETDGEANLCVGQAELVLSVLCEPVSTWQSSANELAPSGSKRLPLRQGGGAAVLGCGAVDEVALLSKMVVKRGVN